jgi:hypothetical protein
MDTLMGGLASNVSARKLLITIVASELFNGNLQHNLVDRETPKAYYTKSVYVNMQMAEKTNSGMVKDDRMQQWAIRMLLTYNNGLKRQRLNRCGWVAQEATRLRYSPFLVGNFKVIRQQLECQLCCSQDFSLYHFLIFHSLMKLLF